MDDQLKGQMRLRPLFSFCEAALHTVLRHVPTRWESCQNILYLQTYLWRFSRNESKRCFYDRLLVVSRLDSIYLLSLHMSQELLLKTTRSASLEGIRAGRDSTLLHCKLILRGGQIGGALISHGVTLIPRGYQEVIEHILRYGS